MRYRSCWTRPAFREPIAVVPATHELQVLIDCAEVDAASRRNDVSARFWELLLSQRARKTGGGSAKGCSPPTTEASPPRAGRWFLIFGLLVFCAGAWRMLTPFVRTAESDTTGAPIESVVEPAAAIPIPDDLSDLEPELAQAIRAHVDAVRNQPTNAVAMGQLGLLYEAHGLFGLALRCYESAAKLAGAHAKWSYFAAVLGFDRGITADVESELRAVVAVEPDFAPAHDRLGWALLHRNDFVEAAQAFETVMRLRPTESAGYVGLGQSRLASGDVAEAIELLNRALQVDARCNMAHYLLGRAYAKLGDKARSAEQFARGQNAGSVHVADPWLAEIPAAIVGRTATILRAVILNATGRRPTAIGLMEQLALNHSDDPEVLTTLAWLYLSARRDDEAEVVLQRALATGRADFRAHTHMAEIARDRGRLGEALDHIEQATDLAPNKAWPFHVKGTILARMGRSAEAIDALSRAAELPETKRSVYVQLAQLLVASGQWDRAIEALETVRALDPRSVTVHFNLGMSYAEVGRLDDAAVALRAALALAPGQPRIINALRDIDRRRAER